MYKKIIVTTITLALAGQLTTLAAKDLDDGVPSGAGSQSAFIRSAPLIGMEVGTIDAQLIAEAMPMVDRASGGLFITAPFIDTLLVMNVRVYDSDGNKVMNARSFGEPLELMALDLQEGQYRYEAVTVFMLDEPIGHGADYTDEGISRSSGTFYITGDTLYEDQRQVPQDTHEEASVLEQIIKSASYLAGVTLDVLIPSAHAADLTASSENPIVFFNDTGTTGDDEWLIEGNGGFADFRVLDTLGTNIHQVIDINGTSGSTLNSSTLVVDSDGDIHWANSSMHLDKGQQALSLGWSSTPGDISISSTVPDIRLHDETDTSEAELQLENGVIQIWGRANESASWQDIIDMSVLAPDDTMKIDSSGLVTLGGTTSTSGSILTLGNPSSSRAQMTFSSALGSAHIEYGQTANSLQFESEAGNRIVEFMMDAPLSSMTLDSSGNLGVGTSSPAASVNVVRNDGSAQVLVQENGAPATRTLFHLKNAGRTHFKIENTDAGSEWVFTNTGASFFISLQGTGGPEFKILNNGNAILAGNLTEGSDVNSKTAITDIDEHEILDLVSALPVTKWEYKDAPGEEHIGPMAQDFYAAFGLGKTETGIATIDTAGVALAAIKALNEENNSLKLQNVSILEQNADLLKRLEKLEHQQSGIQAMMAAFIETQQSTPVLTKTALN